MKKYKRPDYVFKNSQTKWGLEGGGGGGGGSDWFCIGLFLWRLLYFFIVFSNSVVIERAAFL